jgi:hypothetical protein
MLQRWLMVCCALLFVSACTDEVPTEVGDDLLPSRSVRTFEIILEADDFLTFDTTFSGFAQPRNASFLPLANQFQGVLDVNVLLRFAQPPSTITVRNAAGTVVTDSTPSWFRGRLVLQIDTLDSESTPPLIVSAFHTTEPWDVSASWTLRVDTGAVELPWSMPGGTRGAQIDTATWEAGDSIVLAVDSQTVAQWSDTTNDARGAVVVMETNGARVRVIGAVLRLEARSDLQPDTVVTANVGALRSIFVFNPPPPPPNELRVGGVPAWRTMLGVRSDLADLVFPCPGVSNCQLQLDSAHINRAELLLQTVAAPAGFLQEDTTLVQVRTLVVTPGVPIERSPLGVDVCGGSVRCLLNGRAIPSYFTQGQAHPVMAFDVTNYILALVDDEIPAESRPPFALTLLDAQEPSTIGFSTFAPGARLRLVLTAPVETPQ